MAREYCIAAETAGYLYVAVDGDTATVRHSSTDGDFEVPCYGPRGGFQGYSLVEQTFTDVGIMTRHGKRWRANGRTFPTMRAAARSLRPNTDRFRHVVETQGARERLTSNGEAA